MAEAESMPESPASLDMAISMLRRERDYITASKAGTAAAASSAEAPTIARKRVRRLVEEVTKPIRDAIPAEETWP